MTLSDLTSARAVQDAIDECDRLGRDAFLGKYGFGRAREYFLEADGNFYDSKAIAGAAYGFQFPGRGPLQAKDFSGGDLTVRNKLEALGFTVVVLGASSSAPGPDIAALERTFHLRMIDIYKTAKAEVGYNASRFLSMVTEHGGVQTARILLRASAVSEGYTALWERQRLDLTVEAVILEDQWHPLFTQAERDTAIRRLTEYGFDGILPRS